MKNPIIIIGAALLAVSAQASAQPVSPVTVSGSVSTGARLVTNDTDSSKLTEYRDFREGGFLPRLTLDLFDSRNGRFFEFRGTDVSLDDQALAVRGGTLGVWSLNLDWRDVPHH